MRVSESGLGRNKGWGEEQRRGGQEVEREEAEQDELRVAKVTLSLAGAMRKAAKVVELAGVAESAKARLATQRWAAF